MAKGAEHIFSFVNKHSVNLLSGEIKTALLDDKNHSNVEERKALYDAMTSHLKGLLGIDTATKYGLKFFEEEGSLQKMVDNWLNIRTFGKALQEVAGYINHESEAGQALEKAMVDLIELGYLTDIDFGFEDERAVGKNTKKLQSPRSQGGGLTIS